MCILSLPPPSFSSLGRTERKQRAFSDNLPYSLNNLGLCLGVPGAPSHSKVSVCAEQPQFQWSWRPMLSEFCRIGDQPAEVCVGHGAAECFHYPGVTRLGSIAQGPHSWSFPRYFLSPPQLQSADLSEEPKEEPAPKKPT